MNLRSIRFRMTAWYAGLLVCLLVLFGAAVYLGLGAYLERTLRAALSEQARTVREEIDERIADKRLPNIVNFLNEKFAPQLNARFIRITDGSGEILYVSQPTADGELDPAMVPRPLRKSEQEYASDVRLPNGERVLVQIVPINTAEGRLVVEVGSLYAPIDAVLWGLLMTFALGMPLMVAIAIGGGYFLMRRALIQVDEITIQAEHISSRNLSQRLPVLKTGDELERLTLALNRMMGRLEDAFQHINRFSADVSHELRTPLTILCGELEAIVQHERVTPEVLDLVGSALEETARLRTIVDQLRAISRLDAGDVHMQKVPLDLGQLTTSTAEQMLLLAEEKSITVRCEPQTGVNVEGDPSRLKQLVVNLLDNAIRYTGERGLISVSVTRQNGSAILLVADNGVGIPPESLPHVFERFYRADKARTRYSGGSGLGLSIVKAICSAHRGEIEVSSTEGVGTVVAVRLPLSRGINADSKESLAQFKTASSS
ncbi:MAG TPA: ATP-binding protein [Terriglobia bacterium]|nr:ATP-binding protein [Terriglobia bacterium]